MSSIDGFFFYACEDLDRNSVSFCKSRKTYSTNLVNLHNRTCSCVQFYWRFVCTVDSSDAVPCTCGTPTNDNCFPIPLERGHDLAPCIPFRRSLPLLNDQCELSEYLHQDFVYAYSCISFATLPIMTSNQCLQFHRLGHKNLIFMSFCLVLIDFNVCFFAFFFFIFRPL